MLIAQEKLTPFTFDADETHLPLFCRIDITQRNDIDNFLALDYHNKTPVLFFQSNGTHETRMDTSFIDEMTKRHLDVVEIFLSGGISRMTIAADNDGALHKLISLRNTQDIMTRAAPLFDLYEAIARSVPQLDVILTVEDLSPGGIDATDGVAMARELAHRGLKAIIATAGSRDFPPLFDRRATQKKPAQHDEFVSGEPALASALWLVEHTSLDVYGYAFLDDRENAINLARDLGLKGVIEKARIKDI